MLNTLREAAEKIFLIEGFSKESLEILEKQILDDDRLLLQAIHLAAYDALTSIQCKVRSTIAQDRSAPLESQRPKTFSKDFQSEISQSMGKFYAWPMMDGRALAMATREDVLLDAERYKRNAFGNLKNAKFLEAVAAKMKERQAVKEVWSEEQLQALMDKAKETSAKVTS
jgi:hypothetical protein